MSEKENTGEIDPAVEAATVSIPTTTWWSSWLDVAQAKSAEVLDFVKKDLDEITAAVKSEAITVVNSTAAVLKDSLKLDEPESTASSLKRSVSSFLGSVSTVLNPLPEDEGEEAILIQNDVPVPLSRFQARLFELIKNPETFTKIIEETQTSQFESWLTIGEDQMTTEKLTKLLVASPDLHNQYETLVPEHVTHIDFWRRFLFRKALLEDEESLREARANKEKQQAGQIQWEKEDFAKDIDLTEEEQMKILADYDREKKKSEDAVAAELDQTGISNEELMMGEKHGMVVVGDSSQVSSSSENTESKDTDDWEKDFELDDPDIPAK